jgi:hypothetical protein
VLTRPTSALEADGTTSIETSRSTARRNMQAPVFTRTGPSAVRVFDAYVQAESGPADSRSGLGLGLHLRGTCSSFTVGRLPLALTARGDSEGSSWYAHVRLVRSSARQHIQQCRRTAGSWSLNAVANLSDSPLTEQWNRRRAQWNVLPALRRRCRARSHYRSQHSRRAVPLVCGGRSVTTPNMAGA